MKKFITSHNIQVTQKGKQLDIYRLIKSTIDNIICFDIEAKKIIFDNEGPLFLMNEGIPMTRIYKINGLHTIMLKRGDLLSEVGFESGNEFGLADIVIKNVKIKF